MSIAIIGNGGLGTEVKTYLKKTGIQTKTFVSDKFYNDTDDVYKLSEFDPTTHLVLICISDVFVRANIVKTLPPETKYFTYIHPSAQVYTEYPIGEGSIICPNVVITTNTKIGKHVIVNYNTTIGHDVTVNDYCTINPNSSISGDCKIGSNVFIGAGSSIREKLSITNHVVVGMGTVVVKDINEKGTYVGVPSKKIK